MPRKPDIKKIDRIVKELSLSRYQRRKLHDAIAGENFSLEEIRQIAEEIKRLYPKKQESRSDDADRDGYQR